MRNNDVASISQLYLEMVNKDDGVDHINQYEQYLSVAFMNFLRGRKFPFQFTKKLSGDDDELESLEYLTYPNTTIGRKQVQNIIDAHLNNTLGMYQDRKTKGYSNRVYQKIFDEVMEEFYKVKQQYEKSTKYKELDSQYEQ